MEIRDSESAALRAGATSPPNGPLPDVPRYTGEPEGPASTGKGGDDDLSCPGPQQSGVTGGTARGLAAPSSSVIAYSIQQQQLSHQQQASHPCGQQSTSLHQQLQQMQTPPQTGGPTGRYTDGRVDAESPLLGSVTGASLGSQQLSDSPRQHGEAFLQQQPPPPLCSSSRGSPIVSTASTPPLPQVHATATGVAPIHSYVSPRGTSPVLKDLSDLLAAMGSSSGSSRPCALAGGSTVVQYGGAGLPAAVHALGNICNAAVDRQEEETRAATSAAAAASMQALHRLVQDGGCLVPLPEPRGQATPSAHRALKEASETDVAELKNSRPENEEEAQLLQQHQMDKGESALLATCSAQLEKLNLSSHRERGEPPLPPQQGQTESLLGPGGGTSHSFEDFLSQVHKLLRSSFTSSASSASTPRVFCSGRPTATAPVTPVVTTTPLAQTAPFATEGAEAACKQKWDSSKEQGSGSQWGHDFLEEDLRNAVAAGQATKKQEEDDAHKNPGLNNGSPSTPIIDIAVLQAVAASLRANIRGVQSGASPLGGPRDGKKRSPSSEGLSQKKSSHMELQTVLMLPELHRQAIQQRGTLDGSRATDGGGGHDSDFLQNALEMLEDGKNLAHKEVPQQQQHPEQQLPEPPQHPTAAIPTVQLSPPERRRGSPHSMFAGNRTPTHRASSGRLLAPTYQTYDEIQSAPNPSTPIIRGNDKISVEQFLMSFPFTRTMDYAHAALKFCADHNLVVKLLGYHGKRVELLERQYCCRIQTSAQASSFPGYPNGRCVLFTGGLTSLLRACSDLYAVVDTSSPGLRTNIEGYRVCLVVPGDFVGRLLRSNCAGLHALQEVGGRSVHIALGNLCVVMRGNYSERVLLIDGNLEGVCQVLEYTAAQLQDFLRRYAGSPGPTLGSPQSLLTRYEFLDYPKRIELHLST